MRRTRGAERFFVDASVVLYSADPADRRKQEAARQWLGALWETGAGRLSWQVLHEFYVNAVRRPAVKGQSARTTVETLAFWQPVETSLGLVQRAWYWLEEAQLSYWDA